jgi:hypothetical protein
MRFTLLQKTCNFASVVCELDLYLAGCSVLVVPIRCARRCASS